ncbi:MAG TPA: YcnI family protein [Pseudonocardiaceae bacterium]
MTAAVAPRTLLRSSITACGLAVALAVPAAAHVEITPSAAAQGGETTFAFQVPNEEPAAGTVKLQVTLPTDHPVDSVRTRPLTGWTATVTKQGDAVRTITWTAQPGVRINPGEFQEFEVAAGPLPKDTDELVMPTTQTYDNGTVVAWDQPPAPEDAQEPEHPAPVLNLVPSAEGAEGHGGDHGAGPSVTRTTGDTHATDSTARWLGGAGLVLGALGLGLAAGAVLRIRRGKSA